MKKKTMILLASVLCLSVFTASSQFVPGIKGGLSSGYLSGFEGDNRISGHAGFFLHHTINSRWCFQPELLYSGEGQQYVDDGEERTLALDYIQVPLMIQYYPVKKFYFEAGPQLGLLASARDKGNSGDKINVKDDFTTTQLGLNLGMGVHLTNNVGLYARYSFGLTDVSDFDNVVDQSRVAQLGIAVRLK